MVVVVEVTLDNWIFRLAIGDWHLVPPGEDTGALTGRLKMLVEGRFVWRLGVQVPMAGPSGLLKRLVRLVVLVFVEASLGDSTGNVSLVCR